MNNRMKTYYAGSAALILTVLTFYQAMTVPVAPMSIATIQLA